MSVLRYVFIIAVAVSALVSGVSYAQSVTFTRIKLEHGISIEIPSHWNVLGQDTRNNLRAAGEAMTKNSNLEVPGSKESLLVAKATPEPTGAIVRISVRSPSPFTGNNLANTSETDMKNVQSENLNTFRILEASGGPKILEMLPARVGRINKRPALIISYVRASPNETSPWLVAQHQIPVSSHMIEFTLSYRQSDAIVWKPIMEYIKNSLRF